MSARPRPYFQCSISDLEEMIANSDDAVTLDDVRYELAQRRQTDRVSNSVTEIRTKLAKLADKGGPKADPSSSEPMSFNTISSPTTAPPPTTPSPEGRRKADPFPPISNTPESILSAWTALEVLSPPTFLKPENLSGEGRRAVAELRPHQMPWSGTGEKSRKNYRLYYQVVLGSIRMDLAVKRLLSVYGDRRPDPPTARGEAIVAVALLEKTGLPVEEGAGFVSSFAWGLPVALGGDLAKLGDWPEHEGRLAEELASRLRRVDAEGKGIPVNRAIITDAFDWLVEKLRLPMDLVKPPSFAIRSYQYYRSPDPPEPLLLNSFFLNDLRLGRTLFQESRAPQILRRYLGAERPATQTDLLRDDRALEHAVQPALIPPGRWPSPSGQPLVLLQQAAVNLAGPMTSEVGIVAVNGPPGTGKTTLLRDIVAQQVVDRAKAMASFDDPEHAFFSSGQQVRAGQSWLSLYRVAEILRGYEIVVASSNNKAVENISAELPATSSISPKSPIRYLKSLSDHLHERDTWGLVAAVLGNATNRARFRERFWWDDDYGMSTYLANASGSPRLYERKDEDGVVVISRAPTIVTEEGAPLNHREALARWSAARAEFNEIYERVDRQLRAAQTVAEHISTLPTRRAQCAAYTSALNSLSDLRAHHGTRPSFVTRFLQPGGYATWSRQEQTIRAQFRDALRATAIDTGTPTSASGSEYVVWASRIVQNAHAEADTRLVQAETATKIARDQLGPRIIDDAFFSLSAADRHIQPPWLADEVQKARGDLFAAAIRLHKAFIDAAARPLRHNLGALMGSLSGKSLGNNERDALLPDLWTSLFMVTPVVSTTFASVDRMLGALPPCSIGWVLIDEAGQAVPQAAVGALIRSKRAVVVGDPIQIEPVVMLPESLTESICRRFGVNPDRFNAPSGSVQTLADATSPYVAEFQTRSGSRHVGIPLLVHRRCDEPMFGISNAIAYERLMVMATPARRSAIAEVLGPSRWINVVGGDDDKWCAEEGKVALSLLATLRRQGVRPDLYIVAPFVAVQTGLRSLVVDSRILEGWLQADPWQWVSERVGTVHTVQGREAEAVIFVLGAQAPHRSGARDWAGGRPNLVNVAVTRAQCRLYVVGNRQLWGQIGVFSELSSRLPSAEK